VKHEKTRLRVSIVAGILLCSLNTVAQTPKHKETKGKVKTESVSTKSKPVKTNRPIGEKISKDALKAAPYLMKNEPDTTKLPHDPIEPGNTFIEKVIDATKMR